MTQEKSIPLTVSAPIIFNSATEEGVQPLLDFMRSLEHHGNMAVAEKESLRLAPYFSSMSVYLKKAIGKTSYTEAEKHDALKKLATPGGLSAIFNAMAACTRNTIISDVAIMPYGVSKNERTSYLFRRDDDFRIGYEYGGHKFHFGFLQIRSGGIGNMNENSTTFPVLLMDNGMMAAIEPLRPEPLLRELQAVLTFVNHDALHHFTTPALNPLIAGQGAKKNTPINDWFGTFPHGRPYEEWAHIGQEKILLIAENNALVEGILKKLDRYFEELRRIGETLMNGSGAQPSAAGKQEAREVVNFFGMMMAHALTRVFPLNHPVIAHCLDRLQQADPEPKRAVWDFIKTIKGKTPDSSKNKPIRKIYEKNFCNGKVLDIIKSYKSMGYDILPGRDADIGYKNVKLLDLINLSPKDVHPHAAGASLDMIAKVRDAADQLTLEMIEAAAKTSGYKPKT